MVFSAWLIGLAFLIGPVIFALIGPIAIQVWVGAYVAGCAGGLVHELVLGRGRVELPSRAEAGASAETEDIRTPLGPQVDIGFFARLISGGLAAVALLLVYNAAVGELSAADLESLADDGDTFGWAIFLGLASPAIWTAGQRLVAARLASLEAKVGNAASGNAASSVAVEEARQIIANARQGHAGSVASRVDHAAQQIAKVAQPAVELAAAAQPDAVDPDQILDEFRQELLITLRELEPSGVAISAMDDATAKLDQALGALTATASTLGGNESRAVPQ
jgi:hypothetical protein